MAISHACMVSRITFWFLVYSRWAYCFSPLALYKTFSMICITQTVVTTAKVLHSPEQTTQSDTFRDFAFGSCTCSEEQFLICDSLRPIRSSERQNPPQSQARQNCPDHPHRIDISLDLEI